MSIMYRCDEGYAGGNCSQVLCDMVSNCSSHGQCVEPNLCACDSGYTGPECLLFSCETKDKCSGN